MMKTNTEDSSVNTSTNRSFWKLLTQQPDDGKGRAFRFAVIWVLAGALTIVVLFVGGKAMASCSVGSEPTCPSPSVVKAKWHAGFYVHESGMPVNKVFNAPARTHDLFVTKYVHLFKHSSAKRKKALLEHATHLDSKRAVRQVAQQMGAKTTCFYPLSVTCAADLEYANLRINTKCAGWHSYPSATLRLACASFTYPGGNQQGLTWDQVRTGLKIGACTVATGAAIVMAVGTRGAGAPAMAAAATSVGCFTTFWEAVE